MSAALDWNAIALADWTDAHQHRYELGSAVWSVLCGAWGCTDIECIRCDRLGGLHAGDCTASEDYDGDWPVYDGPSIDEQCRAAWAQKMGDAP